MRTICEFYFEILCTAKTAVTAVTFELLKYKSNNRLDLDRSSERRQGNTLNKLLI
jgi:hypothetical protein